MENRFQSVKLLGFHPTNYRKFNAILKQIT